MTAFEVYIMTGSNRPIKRLSKKDLDSLITYLSQATSDQLYCSIITRNLNRFGKEISTKIFFGTIKAFITSHKNDCMI